MSSQNKSIYALLQSSRTVFPMQSLQLLTDTVSNAALVEKMQRYVRQGLLIHPRKGIYAKPEYSVEEMACSLFRPSYISLEYVLQRSGIVFQYDSAITSVSYLSRTVDIGESTYSFRRINYELWVGMDGIITTDNVSIATPERAFLDMLYLSAGNCHFDNLHPLNKKVIYDLLPHYQSHKLIERVNKLLKK